MTAIVETSGLGKRYRNRWALSDCTLRIPPGQIAGLVGPNGAGKSNLGNWQFFLSERKDPEPQCRLDKPVRGFGAGIVLAASGGGVFDGE